MENEKRNRKALYMVLAIFVAVVMWLYVNLTGGTNGGNIFVQGALNITGGEITNGYAKTGGNISFNSAKESNLNGVTISGGEATNQGGNVRVFNATTTILNIGGGTHIFGGKAPEADAASKNLNITTGCTVNLADCQIDGYANLIVRVGGFSDNFVMLNKDIQNEVLKRTQHSL